MRKAQLFLPLIIFLLLSLLLYIGLFRDNKGELPLVLQNKPVPEFDLPKVKEPGQRVNAEDFKGQVALLNVWATWCPACRVEHAYLVNLAEKGVPIFGINYKDDQVEAQIWLDRLQDPYQFSVNDKTGTLGIDLGVTGAPETYLIDANGIIRYRHIGIVDDEVWINDLEPRFKQLRKEKEQTEGRG